MVDYIKNLTSDLSPISDPADLELEAFVKSFNKNSFPVKNDQAIENIRLLENINLSVKKQKTIVVR